MRKVIPSMTMSLDGYVASERQRPGQLPEDDTLTRWRLNWMSRASGAYPMGRTTYQEMAAYWPESDQPFAAPMNAAPKDLRKSRVAG